MRIDKSRAIKLRKSGKSYREIRAELGIPASTLSDWFSGEKWSETLKNYLTKKNIKRSSITIRALNNVRGNHLKELYEEAKIEALAELDFLKNHPLFVAGVMLYWGEGDKASKNGFRVSNSDPELIKLYLLFLRRICGAELARIRASLILYPDLDQKTCENYWSKKIGLSLDNFTKSIYIKGRRPTKKLQYGVCTISFSSRFLKEKMLIWISALPKELKNI
jgi:hypothetical protein